MNIELSKVGVKKSKRQSQTDLSVEAGQRDAKNASQMELASVNIENESQPDPGKMSVVDERESEGSQDDGHESESKAL